MTERTCHRAHRKGARAWTPPPPPHHTPPHSRPTVRPKGHAVKHAGGAPEPWVLLARIRGVVNQNCEFEASSGRPGQAAGPSPSSGLTQCAPCERCLQPHVALLCPGKHRRAGDRTWPLTAQNASTRMGCVGDDAQIRRYRHQRLHIGAVGHGKIARTMKFCPVAPRPLIPTPGIVLEPAPCIPYPMGGQLAPLSPSGRFPPHKATKYVHPVVQTGTLTPPLCPPHPPPAIRHKEAAAKAPAREATGGGSCYRRSGRVATH